MDIEFTIDGHPMVASVSVSPDIDELLLGSDWLVHNSCQWDFAAGTVRVGDHLLKTHKKRNNDACKRVVVTERCVVPPRHEANVPVRVMEDETDCQSIEWVVEPRVVSSLGCDSLDAAQ